MLGRRAVVGGVPHREDAGLAVRAAIAAEHVALDFAAIGSEALVDAALGVALFDGQGVDLLGLVVAWRYQFWVGLRTRKLHSMILRHKFPWGWWHIVIFSAGI